MDDTTRTTPPPYLKPVKTTRKETDSILSQFICPEWAGRIFRDLLIIEKDFKIAESTDKMIGAMAELTIERKNRSNHLQVVK